ncbi:MAG: phosphatidate cytidylyltransferase [Waddliaceae bacterium]|jgi:phosphatidate cytidylyltransferase|nr:phosphatidate cytidylyltransferase [Waddliaceae bacterium]MBT3578693.1 phosphatidate cytidylyltransferase [Waddliaceae bacterium]MBT4445412.1 phosphatidate cytidylyltransferase [Waddliaceae bacterium]MBT6928320.1 phosphatidate cytidylyltransferase [Waddliaceae bacterium]MBT7265006.1 phosphatidate cytidylyltransferase [Waddliaceae bacterium]
MKELRQRIFVGGGVIALLVAMFIMVRNPAFLPVVAIVIAAVVGVALWEYAQLAIAKGYKPCVKGYITCGVAYVAATTAIFYIDNSFIMGSVVFWAAIFSFFIYHAIHQDKAIEHVAIAVLGFVYIAVSMSFIVAMAYQWGPLVLIYLIAVTKVTDIAAYFIGRGFGKKKLAPTISPKKTILGAFAGIIAAAVTSVSFFYGTAIFPYDTKGGFVLAIALGMILSILGQIGDMAESLLKRDAGVKDSNDIPGLGGVLDMLDSLLFTTPALYLFLMIL